MFESFFSLNWRNKSHNPQLTDKIAASSLLDGVISVFLVAWHNTHDQLSPCRHLMLNCSDVGIVSLVRKLLPEGDNDFDYHYENMPMQYTEIF